MKKKTLLILAVLITALACIFTSCSAAIDSPKAEAEEFGYVTFGNGGSRTLNTEYGIKSYNELIWFYTAVKQDKFGFTGQKTSQTRINETTGLSGEIGPLSQGAWVFTLYAYEANENQAPTNNLVYQGASSTIVLKGGETKAVPVSVELKGDKGKIDLSRAYFKWANDSTATGQIYVTVKLTGQNGDLNPTILGPLSKNNANGYQFGPTLLTVDNSPNITAGYYTCTINAYLASDVNTDSKEVNTGATPVATQVMGLRVYGNATTYIKDNLVEDPNTYVDFTVPQQSMVAFNQGQASVPSNPAGIKDSEGQTLSTTIDFGTNLANTTHILTLEVADIDTSSAKFTVADNKSAVASLSFDLKAIGTNESGATTQNPVDTFTNPVTITTYITKGLSTVQVKYNGTGEAPIATDDASASNKSIAKVLDTDEGNSLGYNPATGLLRFNTTHFSEYYVVSDSVVALNETTNTAYETLGAAFTAVRDSETLVILKNCETGASYTKTDPLRFTASNVTLDLNGKSITVNNNFSFLINGNNAVVKNGNIISAPIESSNTNGTLINSYVLVINNCSDVILENLTMLGGLSIGGSNGETPNVGAATNTIVRNCDITSGKWYAVCSQYNSTVTIESGVFRENDKFSNFKGALQASFEGTDGPAGHITVTGGTFIGKIDNSNRNLIEITGGTFSVNPSEYLAFGYIAESTPAGYVVSQSTANELTINNETQLMQFAESVNDGNDYVGETITLKADIDLTGKTWVPIGNFEHPFKGTFDGNNYTISNLTYSGTSDYAGLFGYLAGDDRGEVRNIKFSNVYITNTSNDTGAAVGRIVSGGKVSNVKVLSGSVTGAKRTGGVVGSIKASGTIENCTNAAIVTSTTYNAGGIVGAAYYTENGKEMYITSCENTGNVTSIGNASDPGNCAGGIVGLSAANVSGCTNSATITGSGTGIGGIVGEQKTYGSVTDNNNSGTVTNNNSGNYGNGGIIGWLRYHGSGEVSSYAVSDIISVTGNTNSGNVSGGNDAGGIIGTAYNSAFIIDNTNTATSLSGTEFAAGIVGNYQITETPAASKPALNKLTFVGNTSETTTINANYTEPLIYKNSNPIITSPLAYIDNFSFCEIDSENKKVVFSTDFESANSAELFCPYSLHGGDDDKIATHNNFITSFIVRNGMAEIYRNSAWKSFKNIDSTKEYEISYDLTIDENYNRKVSDGVNNALGFDFGESNTWVCARRLLFAKDGEELKVYLKDFSDSSAAVIQPNKKYNVRISFEQTTLENNNYQLSIIVSIFDSLSSSPVYSGSFSHEAASPFNSYYWDIYYSVN